MPSPRQTYEVEFELPSQGGEDEEHLLVVWARDASEAEEKVRAKHPGAKHIFAELYP